MIDHYIGKYLYFFSDIFICKGYNRTMICDVTNNDSIFISNEYWDIIQKLKYHTIASVFIENFDITSEGNFLSFINYMIDNNYAEIVDDIKFLPAISLEWDSPRLIENAIIDVDEFSQHDYKDIAIQLEMVFCKHVQIRIYCVKSEENIIKLVDDFSNHNFQSVELIVKFNEQISHFFYEKICKNNPGFFFTIYSSPDNFYIESPLKEIYGNIGHIHFITQRIDSCLNCGIINKKGFFISRNVRDFIEGISKNKCLNKKISIDVKGHIKNCPSMSTNFGELNEFTKLIDIIDKENFKKLWDVTKDEIDVCKDCEYRYVCTDCRAYTELSNYDSRGVDISKPLKCGYNPYTNKWSDWTKSPLKRKAIKYYKMEELIKKNEA